MSFYLLHNKNIQPKSEADFKYLYYNNLSQDRVSFISFDNEEGVKYCPHVITGKMLFDYDDNVIDILGRDLIIKSSFNKINNHKDYEVWINVEHIDV